MPSTGFGIICDQVRESTQRNNRSGRIVRFIWHHVAGTSADDAINMMVNATKQLSASYVVDNDNYQGRGWSRITGVCPENYRPWTSASYADDGAMTAEVANSSGPPDYGIADETHEACARIALYCYQALGIPLKRATKDDPTGHMRHDEVLPWFGDGYATSCPLHLDVDRIIARALELLNGATPAPPIPTDEDDLMFVITDNVTGFSLLTGGAVTPFNNTDDVGVFMGAGVKKLDLSIAGYNLLCTTLAASKDAPGVILNTQGRGIWVRDGAGLWHAESPDTVQSLINRGYPQITITDTQLAAMGASAPSV